MMIKRAVAVFAISIAVLGGAHGSGLANPPRNFTIVGPGSAGDYCWVGGDIISYETVFIAPSTCASFTASMWPNQIPMPWVDSHSPQSYGSAWSADAGSRENYAIGEGDFGVALLGPELGGSMVWLDEDLPDWQHVRAKGVIRFYFSCPNNPTPASGCTNDPTTHNNVWMHDEPRVCVANPAYGSGQASCAEMIGGQIGYFANLSTKSLVYSVSVSPSSATVAKNNQTTLTPHVSKSTAAPGTVSWSSSNEGVATVSGGVVTGLVPGTAQICATSTFDTTKQGCSTVTVIKGIKTIKIFTIFPVLGIGLSDALGVSVETEPGVSGAVYWTSSNSNIVSVGSSGEITGVAAGSADVCATSTEDESMYDCTTVTVTIPSTVTNVSVSGSTWVHLNGSGSVSATVTGTGTPDLSVTWSSSNSSIAGVDGNGNISPAGLGWVGICATSNANSQMSACQDVLVYLDVNSVTVDGPSGPLTLGGFSAGLSAYVSADNGAPTDVIWWSTDDNVASVDNEGNVYPTGVGSASICAASTYSMWLVDQGLYLSDVYGCVSVEVVEEAPDEPAALLTAARNKVSPFRKEDLP